MKKVFALATAVLMALSMVACGSNGAASTAPSTPATPPASGTTSAPPVTTPAGTGLYPGTPDPDMITINLGSEPPDLNSITTTTTGSGNVLRATTYGLTELDDKDNPIPAVAESWESAPNEAGVENMVWTFHLNENYKWKTKNTASGVDGTPVTAHDFVTAWTLALTPATGAQYNYMCFIFKNGEKFSKGECKIEDVGFKAIDDYTLQIELENPLAYLLSQLSFYTFKPVPQKGFDATGDAYNHEVDTYFSNGPYFLSEWVHEDHIILEKNPDYPEADKVKVPKVKLAMINDSNSALNAFKAGEVDMIGLSGDQRAMLDAEGQPTISYADGGNWYYQFNNTRKGLDNAKIRRALTMSVDTETYIKNVRKDMCTISYHFASDTIAGLNGPFAETLHAAGIGLKYDAAAAKALFEEGLKEVGITLDEFNALGYSITADTGDTVLRDCQFFQNQWETNLGVKFQISQMTYQARVAATHEGNYDLSLWGWGPDYNDPMTFYDLWISGSGNNDSLYSNPKYDEVILAARKEADPVKREAYFVEAEKILQEDMPVGPSYNRFRDYAVSDKVKGLVRTTFQDLDVAFMEIV